MNKEYKAVIFDVDGTLLDTTEGVVAAVQYTIAKHSLRELPQDELLSFIGPPVQLSFERHYGIHDTELLQELTTTFRNRYKDYELLKAKPYVGIYELCDQLVSRGIQIAVATYKREDYALEILRHFGFDRYSNILYGSDHENKLKKEDIIQKCIRDMKIENTSTVVMVGDTDHDAVGAENIGTDFVGVTYGFGFSTKEEIMQYKHAVGYAERPIDIMRIIEKEDADED